MANQAGFDEPSQYKIHRQLLQLPSCCCSHKLHLCMLPSVLLKWPLPPHLSNFRSLIEPPQDLLDLLWPQVEPKLKEVVELRKQLKSSDQTRPSESILEILKVFRLLRRTFLQDAPFLMEQCPAHPTWEHELFKSEDFNRWKMKIQFFVQDSIATEKAASKVCHSAYLSHGMFVFLAICTCPLPACLSMRHYVCHPPHDMACMPLLCVSLFCPGFFPCSSYQSGQPTKRDGCCNGASKWSDHFEIGRDK